MGNILIALVITLILGLAIAFIVKEKKSGKKCIGCPDGCNCSGNCCNKKDA